MPPRPHCRLKLAEILDGRSDSRERRIPSFVAGDLQLRRMILGDTLGPGAVLPYQQGGRGVDVAPETVND